MHSFQRTVLLLIVIVLGSFTGCSGSGAPLSGGSDPASEAVDAALAPEGVPSATAEKDESIADTSKKIDDSGTTVEGESEETKADDSDESKK